ncbi:MULTISPECIES: hypothetical protein [Erysipelotrichaceae]|uniref:hypothetical protein n=1 Tax=Erysipelotrichaceae TaxID=128827 RepID=UPI000E4DDEFF|nr:hypothetical protein [Absiella sp. AM27-20]RHU03283.1 hypothetical protein DW716_15795 [Absiella sp. AM27-20]DAZ41382.1 MAG TPA: hypothetical protein [Caudoviricetes sp.]
MCSDNVKRIIEDELTVLEVMYETGELSQQLALKLARVATDISDKVDKNSEEDLKVMEQLAQDFEEFKTTLNKIQVTER